MRAALLFLILLLPCCHAAAQGIMLHHLMGFHSMDDSAIYRQLKQNGWRYKGVQTEAPHKPRMYAVHELSGVNEARLYLYSYHKKPLCKVELVCNNVRGFNATIRDSMDAYGFVPDTDGRSPDEENLKVTSSASFVNRDAAMPIHALILYFEERRMPKVSLTIYSDE